MVLQALLRPTGEKNRRKPEGEFLSRVYTLHKSEEKRRRDVVMKKLHVCLVISDIRGNMF